MLKGPYEVDKTATKETQSVPHAEKIKHHSLPKFAVRYFKQNLEHFNTDRGGEKCFMKHVYLMS